MELINGLVIKWHDAASILGVRIYSPFIVKEKNLEIKCLAFLPDFGSVNGVLVGVVQEPNFDLDNILLEYARKNEIYVSFVNGNSSFENIDFFKEIFTDWGFYGELARRPDWL